MIQLSNQLLNSREFSVSLSKLKAAQGLDVKTMYAVSKICKKVEAWIGDGRDVYSKMIRANAALDENGRLLPEIASNGNPIPGSFQVLPERKEELEKQMAEFMNTEFEIKIGRLNPEKFQGANLTPGDLIALEPLFELEVEEESV